MKLISYISSLILGASLVLVFEPFNFWFLTFFIPLAFYFLIREKDIKNSFYLSWFFGFGLWLFGVLWIENSIYYYGGASKFLSYFLVICLSAFLALLNSLFFVIFAYCKTKTNFDILFLFPAVWVGSEWLREFTFSGFPWFYLGYTSLDNFIFSGFIPIFGVFGMSFILIFFPALTFLMFKSFIFADQKKMALVYLTIFSLFLFASFSFYKVEWTSEKDEVNIVIIQPNISIEEKWSIEGEKESVDLFKSKNKEYSSKSKDKDILSVVFWPEVFLPGLKSKYTEVINELEFYASKSNFASVFGVLSKNNDAEGVNNSLMSLGKLNGKFDKQNLVPFGEYVPFPIFNSFFSFFNFNRPNIVPSDNNVLIKSKNLNISSAICYEIAYQDIFLKHGEQSNLLFNASNDNWFGNTIGPYQHLQIARYRAAENRKPLVRSTSTGVSALIDKFGNVVKKVDLDNSDQSVKNSQLIEANIFSRSGHTPFITFGKWPSIIFILIVIFCSFFNRILKNEKY